MPVHNKVLVLGKARSLVQDLHELLGGEHLRQCLTEPAEFPHSGRLLNEDAKHLQRQLIVLAWQDLQERGDVAGHHVVEQ